MFHIKKSQLLRLCREVAKMHQTGVWIKLAPGKRTLLLRRLHTLWLQVKSYLDKKELRRVMATLAFLFGMGFSSSAQIMGPVQINPFGLTEVSGESFLLAKAADIDGDGDIDILGTQYFYDLGTTSFFFIENTGTASNPQFAAPVNNKFGLLTSDFIVPSAIIDLDNDGDLDILCIDFTYPHSIQYYENKGSATNPVFGTPVTDPFGFDPTYNIGYFGLSAGDLDNDGDYDLVYIGYYENLYFENIGSASNPSFAAPVKNPFGLTTVNEYILHSALGDMDNDGDLDLVAIESYENIWHYKNNGSVSSPNFASPVTNAFGIDTISDRYTFTVSMVDLDNDGDLDMLLTDIFYDYETSTYSSNFLYFENTNPANITSLATEAAGLVLYPQPCSDQVTLDLSEAGAGQFTVAIKDITGKQLMLLELTGAQQHTIPITGLSPGMYFVEVSGNGFHASAKLQKQD